MSSKTSEPRSISPTDSTHSMGYLAGPLRQHPYQIGNSPTIGMGGVNGIEGQGGPDHDSHIDPEVALRLQESLARVTRSTPLEYPNALKAASHYDDADDPDEAYLIRLARLKKSRSGHKSVVSRLRRELLALDEEPSNIRSMFTKMEQLHIALQRFAEAQGQYHASLRDSEDVIDSSLYAKEVHAKADHARNQVRAYIDFHKRKLMESEARDKVDALPKYDATPFRQVYRDAMSAIHEGDKYMSGEYTPGLGAVSAEHPGSTRTSQRSSGSRRSLGSCSGSTSSSIRRNRIRAQADKAALEVEAKLLPNRRQLQLDTLTAKVRQEQVDLELQQRAEELNINEKFARAKAQEEVYVSQERILHAEDGASTQTKVRFSLAQPNFESTPQTTVKSAPVHQRVQVASKTVPVGSPQHSPQLKPDKPVRSLMTFPARRPTVKTDASQDARRDPTLGSRYSSRPSSIGHDTVSRQGHARGEVQGDDLPDDDLRDDVNYDDVRREDVRSNDVNFDEVRQDTVHSMGATGQTQTVPLVGTNQTYVMGSGNDVTTEQLTQNLTMWQSGQQDLMRQLHDDSTTMHRTIVDSMNLPKCELSIFTGEAIDYYPFICAFEDNIHKATQDSGTRLVRLNQYCSKEVQSVIRCCSIMHKSRGYDKARELLYQRYGEPFIIAEAWLDRIESLRTSYTQKSLQIYADELLNCREILNAIGHLDELNGSRNLLKLAERLPKELQKGWAKRADNVRLQGVRMATVDDLLEYVQTQARIAGHPVFGKLYMPEGSRRSTTNTTERKSVGGAVTKRPQTKSSFATLAIPANAKSQSKPAGGYRGGGKPRSPQTPRAAGRPVFKQDNVASKAVTCPYCSSNHTLFDCPVWRALNVSDRLKFCTNRRMCVNCLGETHRTSQCPRKSVCPMNNCGAKHIKLLHLPRPQDTNPVEKTDHANDSDKAPGANKHSYAATTATGVGEEPVTKVGLPIVPIKVRGDQGEFITSYAMLDSCSSQTFCTDELAEQMSLTAANATMFLTTLEGKKVPVTTRYVSFEVADLKEQHQTALTRVATRASLNISAESLVTNDELQKWKHLRGIRLPVVSKRQVQILIGQDYGGLFFPERTLEGKFGEPYAVKTIFGWTIHGPLTRGKGNSSASYFIRTDSELLQQVERFWKLDDLGDEPSMSHNDRKVIEIWETTEVFQNGHFSYDIPFKQRPPQLMDNRSLAEKRLVHLGRRLNRDETFKKRYSDEMSALIGKGYAEKVPAELLGRADGGVYYIPHHPVLNEKKPDKVRPVFDCAAKYGNTSLNDHVHQGPDLTNGLVGVMLRFRQDRVAFMADIEAMFHQVLVTEKDRDTLRFLWWDSEVGGEVTVYRMRAHLFGGVWSPSVASYAVKRAASMSADIFDGETVKTVLNNFYVDDCLKSVPDEATAVRLVGQLRDLLAKGGFRLTKWLSNSREVLKSVPADERAKGVKNLDLDHDFLPRERALGLLWDVESDIYTYDTLVKDKPLTKRGVLSVLCSVYDPLGFVSPFIVSAKMIFQTLCRMKLDWDDPIGESEACQWGRWKQSLVHLQKFFIPRSIQPVGRVISRQLHHFSDASERAYGSATYVRTVTDDGRINCVLLVAKGRLTPLKQSTMPRLELTAAVLSAQLDKTVRKEIELVFDKSIFWCDSMIVLYYISNLDARYQTFVANRLEKIRDQSQSDQWRHISTTINPADTISRGAPAELLVSDESWTQGPAFLQLPEEQWPEQPEIVLAKDVNPEIKKETPVFSSRLEKDDTSIVKTIARHYSDWCKFQRAIAWLLRLKSCLITRKIVRGSLRVSELKLAETVIIRSLQVPYRESCDDLKRLNPIINSQGILCVGGRLSHSSLSDRAKHPWVLPGHGHITDLLIRWFHTVNGHAGVERSLADIRQRFWLLGGRTAVKRIVYGCISCKKRKASPMHAQMADLPKDRLEMNLAPFTNVGIDYFGPFPVKRARTTVKRYGCIFTCLVTRAIHVEIAASLDTSSFINALQRFVARRGHPEHLRSDNGTNFVGAEREMREALKDWDQEKLNKFLSPKGIQWHFNPPSASHMGGVWERQIRSIRAVLRGLITQQSLDEEGLATLMCIVENILNSRPITKLSDDPSDDVPLTPNHLLLLREGPRAPPGVFDKADLYGKRWRQVQYLADIFWRRWVKEYLPLLQKRQKWLYNTRSVQVGDLVLVQNELLPRNQWPLGLILETFPGKDGVIRVVKLRYQGSTYVRPISKIILLEGVSDHKS